MKRIIGILIIVLILYGTILASTFDGRSLENILQNQRNLALRLALYGVLTVGVGMLIISGGIDLSIGSVFCLGAVGLGLLLNERVPWGLAVIAVLVGAGIIGLFHGLLVTRLGLQPFIVTLCGLFIYRGLANWLALPDPLAPVRGLARFLSFGYLFSGASVQTGSASNVGIGARSQEVSDLVFLSTGYWHGVPVRLLLFLAIAALAAVFLHWSVYGRYLYAIGSNEQAARYAGVATNRYKVLAYVLCSVLAAVGGMLELLDLKSAAPSNTGSWYELYAITGAVLGGCSLRGGDGTVIGMILGTAVLPLLRNLCNLSAIPSDLEFTVIGLALLAGTIVDEVLKRRAARKG